MTNKPKNHTPCYFPGCTAEGTTREHAPPKSFFPKDRRNQLRTVPSCPEHNNRKNNDDLYALFQFAQHVATHSKEKSVIEFTSQIVNKSIIPQFEHNDQRLLNRVKKGSTALGGGLLKYVVEKDRIDKFMTYLSYAVIYDASALRVNVECKADHYYHHLNYSNSSDPIHVFMRAIASIPDDLISTKTHHHDITLSDPLIYDAKIYCDKTVSLSSKNARITINHTFYNYFKVTTQINSMEI